MPLDIQLSETLPAAEPFYLEFEWSSLINKSVSATTSLLIEAEQRHEWEITAIGVQGGRGVMTKASSSFSFFVDVTFDINFQNGAAESARCCPQPNVSRKNDWVACEK